MLSYFDLELTECLHVQVEKRIRTPDTFRAVGSDADGINIMADKLKCELDGCKDNFPPNDWPVQIAEYMDTVDSE